MACLADCEDQVVPSLRICAAAASASLTAERQYAVACVLFIIRFSHACGSSRAVSDLVEELLGSGVLALSQPPMRFMMQFHV